MAQLGPDQKAPGPAQGLPEERGHVLALLHPYRGQDPRRIVDGAPPEVADREAARAAGAENEYHLPRLVVHVVKHMVAAAVAKDAAELERYEAKAEDAVDYLRRKRPWHVHHREWFVIITLGILQHATVAIFGDPEEQERLMAAATKDYLGLTRTDPLLGEADHQESVDKWVHELWRDAWVGDDPSYSRIPDNCRLSLSACLAAKALTRYLPAGVDSWQAWWDTLLPEEEEELGGEP